MANSNVHVIEDIMAQEKDVPLGKAAIVSLCSDSHAIHFKNNNHIAYSLERTPHIHLQRRTFISKQLFVYYMQPRPEAGERFSKEHQALYAKISGCHVLYPFATPFKTPCICI